jgi:glycosyltransferase involved in cell wall biosynthesis
MSVSPAIQESIALPARPRDFNRPLRVLQVIASVADANGGASTAIWSTLSALRTRGIHADLVTTDENGPKQRLNVPLGEFVLQDGHRVCYFPAWLDRYTTSWPLARWLFSHVSDYDVLHVHGLFRFAPVVAAYAALSRGVPYVLTPHNTLGRWGMRHRKPLLKRLSIGLIEGRIVDRACRVHLCSTEELAQVMQVRGLGARSAVFPLGIDLSTDAAEQTDTSRPAQEAFEGRRVVLFMSRIHEVKGLDRLMRAFAGIQSTYPDLVLVIAGSGDQRLIAGLRRLAQELGIEQRTHWTGYVQGRRKQDLLSRAAVFVLPSHSENFGYVIVEAMLAGVPVVTTLHVPSGEFVAKAGAGIICDGTPERLAQGIEDILEMPEANRRHLGQRAKTMVRKHLSLENFGESLESLYGEVRRASK